MEPLSGGAVPRSGRRRNRRYDRRHRRAAAVAPTISTGTGNADTGSRHCRDHNIPSNAVITPELHTSTTGAITAAADACIQRSTLSSIVITSANHGLKSGSVVQITGA